MRHLLGILLLLVALPAIRAAETKLPADVQKLIETFDTDAAKTRAEAEKAIDKKAVDLVAKLQKMQEIATKKGDLDSAMAIKQKIVSYEKLTEAPPAGKLIEIPAASEGLSLGKIQSGHEITFQYVEGTWGDGGALNNMSPDSLSTPGGCKLKLGGPNGDEFIPPNTKDKPWTYKVKASGEYYLKSGDGSPKDNPGAVTYRVDIR